MNLFLKLQERLATAKAELRNLKINKSQFFDDVYGRMYSKEFDKYNNFFYGKTINEEFIVNLETYVKKMKNEK